MTPTRLLAIGLFLFPPWAGNVAFAAITGVFASIPQGSNVNLTAIGALDWAHWGSHTDTSVNRKAGVSNVIGDLGIMHTGEYGFMFQYADNFNGYTWNDGYPVAAATNTPTGVWVYALPSINSGFELHVPADATQRILNVFVGAFDAHGALEAALSDGSGSYSDSSLQNIGNGPSGVYTLTYSADSPAQTLRVRWRFMSGRPDGNVTFQAAALSASGENHPPVVILTSPAANSNFDSGQAIELTAFASDTDGTIAKVEFYEGANMLGEALSEPFSFQWNDASLGMHVLTARAIDDFGTSRTSAPVEVFVHGVGGILRGTFETPQTEVNLTTEGAVDWIHWGLTSSNSVNRKAGVVPLISNFVSLWDRDIERATDYPPVYAWSDGTPVLSTVSSHTGVFITGYTNGFRIQVPAASFVRQLKVHVGVYGVAGEFQAFLSDASAPLYADATLDTVFGRAYAVYTIDYASATPGEVLHVRYRTKTPYDHLYGNVSLQAATLSGGPTPVRLSCQVIQSEQVHFCFLTQPDYIHTVETSPSLLPGSWQMLSTLVGDGSVVTISDAITPGANQFFRVTTE